VALKLFLYSGALIVLFLFFSKHNQYFLKNGLTRVDFFVLIQVLGFVNRSFTSIKSISATRKKCNSKHKRKKVEKKIKQTRKGGKTKQKETKQIYS